MLGLDGRQYGGKLLELIVLAGASCKSFAIAAKLVREFLEINISAKQVSLLTTMIGSELKTARDERTDAWKNRSLSQPKTVAEPPLALACVQLDGGRMQTREAAAGHGVFSPHWRETKNAGFHRMATQSFDKDPHPELPSCFSNRKNMGKMLPGVQSDECPNNLSDEKPDFSWRPQPLFRTCLASLAGSREFGSMMAAEAERRGFFTASRRAFLADGLPYNWKVQQEYFSTFVPILDIIHPIERLHEVSQSLHSDSDAAWEQTVQWVREVWQGQADQVVGMLKAKQLAIGQPPPDAEPTDF